MEKDTINQPGRRWPKVVTSTVTGLAYVWRSTYDRCPKKDPRPSARLRKFPPEKRTFWTPKIDAVVQMFFLFHFCLKFPAIRFLSFGGCIFCFVVVAAFSSWKERWEKTLRHYFPNTETFFVLLIDIRREQFFRAFFQHRNFRHLSLCFFGNLQVPQPLTTLPETNSEFTPENVWFEYDSFPFGAIWAYFQGQNCC